MKKTPLEKLNSRKIGLPNKFAIPLLRLIMAAMQAGDDVSYKYDFDCKELKGKQVILLADHATRLAYKYVIHGCKFTTPNVVIGYQNIFVKGLFSLMLLGGIIPKKLYQTDSKSVMDMMRVLSMGGSLCIFPEGIQSSSGSAHPIFPATAKFLKKAGVTVVLCKSYGSYLVTPRYKRTKNKGHQEFHYQILFTEEELKSLSVEQIEEKLTREFAYNDFEWNKTARHTYKGDTPLAQGIEKILYHCPKCGSEFTLKTEGERIICTNCQNTVVLNEYYDISPESEKDILPYGTIDDWFKAQRALAAKEAKAGFCYEYECDIYDMHTEKLSSEPFYCCGEGKITLTEKGIRYIGTRHGQSVDLFFDINKTPSFVYVPGRDNDVYYNDIYYIFKPKTEQNRVVKNTLLIEEAHRLINPAWDNASAAAYGSK